MNDVLSVILLFFVIAFVILLHSIYINSLSTDMRNHICWICSNDDRVRYLQLYEEFLKCMYEVKIENKYFITEEEIPILKEILVYFQMYTAKEFFKNSYESKDSWERIKKQKKFARLKHDEYFICKLHDFLNYYKTNVLSLKENELRKAYELSGKDDWRSYYAEVEKIKKKYEVTCVKMLDLCSMYYKNYIQEKVIKKK